MEQQGSTIEHNEGIQQDPFWRIRTKTGIQQNSDARITMTVGRALQYGELKCSASVSIECPQQEAHINLAGELAFTKALELVNDGMARFGVDRIGDEVEE